MSDTLPATAGNVAKIHREMDAVTGHKVACFHAAGALAARSELGVGVDENAHGLLFRVVLRNLSGFVRARATVPTLCNRVYRRTYQQERYAIKV